MDNFFPPGFWRTVVMLGTTVFVVLGVDLLFGAKLVAFLSKFMNRKFQVDRLIVQALTELKQRSDKEFDVDHSLMHGWGRIVMSGVLIFGSALILTLLLPRLH